MGGAALQINQLCCKCSVTPGLSVSVYLEITICLWTSWNRHSAAVTGNRVLVSLSGGHWPPTLLDSGHLQQGSFRVRSSLSCTLSPRMCLCPDPPLPFSCPHITVLSNSSRHHQNGCPLWSLQRWSPHLRYYYSVSDLLKNCWCIHSQVTVQLNSVSSMLEKCSNNKRNGKVPQ